MELTSWGAAGEVTGSKHLIKIGNSQLLLDCGMHQGGSHRDREKQNSFLPFRAKNINAVVLSHGHLDHCGSLPTLVKNGFQGPIYSSPATAEVAELIMRDSARIQVQDARYHNTHRKAHEKRIRPIYTEKSVEKTLGQIKTVPYFKTKTVISEGTMTLYDAGHILGSSLVHLRLKEGKQVLRVAYTGDLGQKDMPILRNPDVLPETDILICESTYGERFHEGTVARTAKLVAIVKRAMKIKGKIFVPAFALGRMQTLIYTLHKLTDSGKIPRLPIYVDSPLTVDLTKVFSAHPDCYDTETQKFFTKRGEDPFGFRNLHYISSVQESKRLNQKKGPMIILSTSGMLEAGRILHHLNNGLADSRNALLIVGYMAKGTLGRKIIEGAKTVQIFGERIAVKAKIEKINAYSAHADQKGLLDFIGTVPKLKKVVLVHGDESARQTLEKEIQIKFPVLEVLKPVAGRHYRLL